jgi:hypothetical protein
MDIQISRDLEYVFNALTQHDIGKKYSTPVMGYISLFGVTPFHLKAPKMRLLMSDMVKLFDAQAFSYKKKHYQISHAGIIEALNICIRMNFEDGLDNHNYLKKVMISISGKEETGKSIAAEKDLRQREQSNLRGDERSDVPIPRAPIYPGDEEVKPGKLTPAEIEANKQRARDLANGLFGSKEVKGKSL